MKIVHVSTHGKRGGAGLAAWRLHAEMRKSGIDSSMICLGTHDYEPGLIEVPVPLGEAANRSMAFRDLFVTVNRTPVSNTYFSDSLTGSDLNQHPEVQAADIVHLHWVSGFVRPPHLAQLLATGKTVVWTLHDLAPFTGGCHYPAGCTGYLHGCRSCPQLRAFADSLPAAQLSDKLSLWAGGRLSLIALNSWMAGLASQAPVFKDRAITIIPNGIDLDTFSPAHRETQRQAWGVSSEATVVLFAADMLTEIRKGAPLLASALGQLAKIDRIKKAVADGRLVLLAAGQGHFPETGPPVRSLGWCDEAQMARNYAGADLFVLPSQEDNLPNTVVESLACGTPVAAFAVGGVPEMIVDGVTGRLTSGSEADDLAGLLREIVSDPAAIKAMRSQCRAHAEKHFDIRVNTQAVVKHYHQVHAPARRTRTQSLGDFPGPGLSRFLETPSPEILGLQPSEFLNRVTNLADRTEVEQVFATTRKQSDFIEVLRNERNRLTAETEAARAEAARALSDGQKYIDRAMHQLEQQSVESQKHIDALTAQLNQLAATSAAQTKHIKVLESERDRLTAESSAAQREAIRASKEGQNHIDALKTQLEQLAATSREQSRYIGVMEKELHRLGAELAEVRQKTADYVAVMKEQGDYIKMLEVVRDQNADKKT